MALKFTKKAAKAAVDEPEQEETSQAQTSKPKSMSKASGGMSFMKTGKAAAEALAHEEAKAEAAKAASDKLWRFWMPAEDDRQITFLDGDLNDDGMLDIPYWHEHAIRINGNWQNFVCTAEADQSQPCPICETGDKASFVGVMTILDHTPHKIQSGKNAGKTLTNTRKLFVMKRKTMAVLKKIAAKRGGLRFCTFDVSRSDENNPSVGDQFDFVHKYSKASQIAEKYDLKVEDVEPADYKHEITYHSPETLIELGVSKYKPQANGGSMKSAKSAKDEL